jgi:hypothetical protein
VANFLHLGGRYGNNLARAVSPVFSVSPGSDANFPTTALYDSIQDLIWKASANTALALVFDQNLIAGGNLDTWPLVSPWFTTLTGTATVTQTSVGGEVVTGSAAKLTAGSGTAILAYPLTVVAGETLSVSLALRGDGANAARVQLYNRQSGHYWTGSAWQLSPTFVTQGSIPRTSAAYTTTTISALVETFLTCGTETPTVELRLASSAAAGIAYFDNVFAWPTATFLGVMAHNIDPVTALQWSSSTDGVTPHVRSTPTIVRPSLWSVEVASGGQGERYQHIVFQNPNGETPWIGELVLGQHLALARGPNYPLQTTLTFPQLRSYAASGAKRSAPLSLSERRSLQLSFRYGPKAEYQEARDRIFRATLGGHYPSVIVPDDSDAEVVMFGYIAPAWPVTQPFLNLWEADLVFEEEPHPVLTA